YIVTSDSTYIPSDIDLGLAKSQDNPILFRTKEGKLRIDAEDVTVYRNLIPISSFKLLKGAGLATQWASSASPFSNNLADAAVNVRVDEAGVYYIWANVKTISNTAAISLSFNQREYEKAFIGSTGGIYQWKRIGKTSVNAGEIINIRLKAVHNIVNFDSFVINDSIIAQPVGLYGDTVEPDNRVESIYDMPPVVPPAVHPRLYFTEKDIVRLVGNFKKEQNQPAYRVHTENLNKGLESSFTGELKVPATGKSNYSASDLGIIESLAFDYAMTRNTESGIKAISAMKNYLDTVVFIGKDDTYVRPAGQTVFHISQVYDWCYDLLSREEKLFLIERGTDIIKGGMETKWPPTGGGVTGHTSEAQLQRDMLAFGIATYDERPDIYNVVAGLLYKNYVPAKEYMYLSHKNHQGSMYGTYRGQWEYNATFIMNKLGVDELYGENQKYVPYWFIYARRPDGIVMRDGDARTDGFEVESYQIRSDNMRSMLFAGNYFQDPYIKSDLTRQSKNLSSFGYGHGNITPVEFLCVNDPDLEVKARRELPLSYYFGSPEGEMIARTGWSDGINSPDAIAYFKIKETHFTNHAHDDAGHFQLYYKGILANDAGTYGTYGSEHDRGYYKRSVAHNTMAVRNPNKPVTYLGYSNMDGGQRTPNQGKEPVWDDIKNTDEYVTGKVLGHEFESDSVKPDYTYLSGNISRAYHQETVSDYERSFMFYNLNEKESPAALIVFDRVTAANKNFQKAWLLNGPSEPKVSNNRTVFTNNDLGYNGKMTVDTLLPKPENTEIVVIGGEGKDAFAGNKNFSNNSPLNKTLTHEGIGYRIEVSPKQQQATDYFLNVLQVTDADSNAEQLDVKLIENSNIAGAVISDRITVFRKAYGRSRDDIEFTVFDESQYKIAVTDMAAGTWRIFKDDVEYGEEIATEDGGMIYFTGGKGRYKIVYKNTIALRDTTAISFPKLPDNEVEIRINDNFIYSDVLGRNIDGNIMIPLKAVCEKIGAEVTWDSSENSAVVVFDEKIIILPAGTDDVITNGKYDKLSCANITIDGRMLVPVDFYERKLEAETEYDKFAKCIYIKMFTKFQISEEQQAVYLDAHKDKNPLTVYYVTQSGSDGNIILQAVDGDITSRWAHEGDDENPAWGIYDLGKEQEVGKIYIAFYNGSTRKNKFDIQVSSDGENYTTVLENIVTSGTTDDILEFTFLQTKARYIKFIGKGTSSSLWNSINEIVFAK
ncbi:MAG: hypothetical protein GX800_01030, partial [Clostridiaceae bacterium]|nr:hypothetical protein [Clostridiaceae bacterium]